MTFLQWLVYLLRISFCPGSVKTMEWKMLRLINCERKFKDKPKIRMQSDLRAVARKHSKDMAKKDYFSHRDKKGKRAHDRLKIARITDVSSGENLAKIGGFPKPVWEAHVGLMKSTGHRRNILNKDYNTVGVGVVKSRNGVYYFTQVFAHRELIFTKKIRSRVRLQKGLRLKGKAIYDQCQVLFQMKSLDHRVVVAEEVFEVEDGGFDCVLWSDVTGLHKVSVYICVKGKKFYLVNEFEVKFTNWF